MIDFFTKQEKNVILFLLGGLFIGGGIKIYHAKFNQKSLVFDQEKEKHQELEGKIETKAAAIDSLLKRPLERKSDHSTEKDKNTIISPIDINSAEIDQLQMLPNIGPVIAERIINHRKKIGRFTSLDQLTAVKGVGPKTLEKIKPLIVIK